MDPLVFNTPPTVHGLGQANAHFATGRVEESEALRAFDAYFLGEMLRRSAPSNPTGLFDGGTAGRMYQDHFYQELARIVAEQGSFGLASTLEGRLGGAASGEAPVVEPEEARR